MAEGAGKGSFPDEIIAEDIDLGKYKIELRIPDLKTETQRKGLKKITVVKNGKCDSQISSDFISVIVEDSKKKLWSYEKKLQDKINDSKSKLTLEDGKVTFVLVKVEKISWAANQKYFLKPPESD